MEIGRRVRLLITKMCFSLWKYEINTHAINLNLPEVGMGQKIDGWGETTVAIWGVKKEHFWGGNN